MKSLFNQNKYSQSHKKYIFYHKAGLISIWSIHNLVSIYIDYIKKIIRY